MQVRGKFGKVIEPCMSKVEILMNPAIFALNWRYVFKDSRGRNNGRLTDMTGKILLFVRPEFCVIIEMTSHFFSLQQLDKCLLEIP